MNAKDIVKKIYDGYFKNTLEQPFMEKISASRSKAVTFVASSKSGPTAGKNVFIKCTPEFTLGTKPSLNLKKNLNSGKLTKAQVEVSISRMIKKAIDLNATPHLSVCHNDTLSPTRVDTLLPTQVDTITFNPPININGLQVKYFTVLISEFIDHITLGDVISNYPANPTSSKYNDIIEVREQMIRDRRFQIIIFLQIFHAFYILNTVLGIKHLDNHYGNIILHRTANNRNTYNKYVIVNATTITPIQFYLPNVGWSIKVIDFDGSFKYSRGTVLKNNFSKSINNPNITKELRLKGNVSFKNNHMFNMYKLLKPLIVNPLFGVNSSVGFFSHNVLKAYTANVNSLKNLQRAFMMAGVPITVNNMYTKYHMLVKVNGANRYYKAINIPNTVLKSYNHVFNSLKNSLQRPQNGSLKNTYDMRILIKNSYENMEINSQNRTASNLKSRPLTLNPNLSLKNIFTDPFTKSIVNPNKARIVVENTNNKGRILQLYDKNSLVEAAKIMPKMIPRTGKSLTKNITRLKAPKNILNLLKDYKEKPELYNRRNNSPIVLN